MRKHGVLLLALAAALNCAALLASVLLSRNVQAGNYAQKVAAATHMCRCMEQIKAYKEELGIEVSPEDVNETGLIGQPFTMETTTSLGAIEAKRTAASPDMAALLVELYTRAGLQPGDRVGAAFSGSFPGLDLATLCAAEAMGLDIVYICSVGASTYGANQPALTFPDMAHRLAEDGLIAGRCAAFSLGGDFDLGVGMEEGVKAEILDRLASYGAPILMIEDYEENVLARMDIYAQIDCFVAVGGNITNVGRDALDVGQGLLRAKPLAAIDEASGLVERYCARGTPVIHLLNIKKLAADHGLPFDPAPLPEIGTSHIYYERAYPSAVIISALLFDVIILTAVARSPHKLKQVIPDRFNGRRA